MARVTVVSIMAGDIGNSAGGPAREASDDRTARITIDKR
jgi:hypothetical protein